MILVGDIVEHGLDGFGKKAARWRVEFHMQRVEDTLKEWKPENVANEILKEILEENLTEEIEKRKSLNLPHARRYKLIYCKPEEATHLSLVGVCGGTALISECKKIGRVNWDEKKIKEAQDNAISDFWLKQNHFPADWYWE